MTPDLAQYLPGGEARWLLLGLVALFVLINGLTWAAFAIDKSRAEAGGYRIPEKNLLLLALLGGWPAAKLAQLRFSHQPHGRSFGLVLNLIVAVQVIGLGALLIPMDLVTHQVTALKDSAIASVQPAPDPDAAAPEKVLPRRFGPGSDQTETGTLGSIGG